MIQFYKPTLKRRDMDSVLQTMVNEKIGPGERSRAFVQAFCEAIGASSANTYRTYPEALRAALVVAGATAGTRVAASPLSPAIYKDIIESIGAELVMVDIDKETGCPDEGKVAASGAEILLLYENFGTLPVKYNEKTTFAESCDYSCTKVIEDISESIGSSVKDVISAGKVGQIVVCALEDDSVISAAGGAIMAVRGEFLPALRENRPSKYIKMPDLNSALGMVQLLNMDEQITRRREILASFQQSLARTRHKQFGLSLVDFRSNAFSFAVLLDSKPEETIKFAKAHDVPVKMAFEQCLLKDFDGDPFQDYPVASPFFYRTVLFPLYPFLKTSEIDMISKVVAHLP